MPVDLILLVLRPRLAVREARSLVGHALWRVAWRVLPEDDRETVRSAFRYAADALAGPDTPLEPTPRAMAGSAAWTP